MKYAYELTLPCADLYTAELELQRLETLEGFLVGRILPGIPATVRAFFELVRPVATPEWSPDPETWNLPQGVRLVKIPTPLEAVFEAK